MTNIEDIPRTPLHQRALALLESIKEFDRSRSDLVELNEDNEGDTRNAIRYLRDKKLIFICDYTPYMVEPIYRVGCETDVPRPRYRKKADQPPPPPRDFKIPAPDPVLAALFGLNRQE